MKIWLSWHKGKTVGDLCWSGRENDALIRYNRPTDVPSSCSLDGEQTEWREFDCVGVLSLPANKTQSKLARIRAILEEKD